MALTLYCRTEIVQYFAQLMLWLVTFSHLVESSECWPVIGHEGYQIFTAQYIYTAACHEIK